MPEQLGSDSENLQDETIGRIEKRGELYFWVRSSGEEFQMYGYGSGPKLDLDPRIDLTKPIFEQAAQLWAEDALEEAGRTVKAA